MIAVAVLGAGGHIGRSLAWALSQRQDVRLDLYTRDPSRLGGFADRLNTPTKVGVYPTSSIDELVPVDVVLNCVGHGDQSDINIAGVSLLMAQDRIENQILAYLDRSPETLYVTFSSGAVFGSRLDQVTSSTLATIDPRDGTPANGYAAAKIYTEVKHRMASPRNIVDFRLYGYVSAFQPLSGRYLLSDVIRAIENDTELETTGQDFERDYCNPADLVQLVDLCLAARPINRALDVYSRQPVSKFELLDVLKERFGLRYRVSTTNIPTTTRTRYYSTDHAAADVGYRPIRNAVENVIDALHERKRG